MGRCWKTASTNEVLAITGWRIEGIKITQKSFIMPGQKVTVIDTMPRDYFLNLQAMTKEKLQCLIPVVFTVEPDVNKRGKNAKKGSQVLDDDEHLPEMTSTNGELAAHRQRNARDIEAANQEDGGDALIKYCRLLGGSKGSDNDQKIENMVKGVIEGETRVLVSSMTMEELFSGREEFKNQISVGIQSEMDQFGLKIYNANVKELRDAPGSNYFHSLSQKAHEGAINRARIEVADAQAKGNIGEAQRHGEQNREIAKINAETAVQKTVQDSNKAKAEATLATNKAMYNRDVEIAQIEASRATESRDEALRKEVEMKRAQTELERLRASDVVKATVLRESKQQAADAKKYEAEAASNAQFYTEQKNADASAYNEQKAADARAYKVKTAAAADVENEKMASDAQMYKGQKAAETNAYNQKAIADAYAYKVKVEAEANFDAAQKDAEAILVRQQKEAEGMTAMAGAYGALAQAFGGPQGLIQYLMIEKGTYAQLANANANAVRGLNPKMTIWNTGSNAGQEGANNSGAGGVDSIRNMYQMLPPLMSTINEQTGITLPEWQFGRLGEQISEREVSGKSIGTGIHVNGKTTNGHSQRQ